MRQTIPQKNSRSALGRFLATHRIRLLFKAVHEESQQLAQPELSAAPVGLAICLAAIPILCAAIEQHSPGGENSLSTIAFGVSALLALVMRKRLHFAHNKIIDWKHALSLTHTAFALGCIPAVIALACAPESFAFRKDVLGQAFGGVPEPDQKTLEVLITIFFLVAVALWVAVTEEYIFRGMLVSVIRRCTLLPSQKSRDISAVIISAVLFGSAHAILWGPVLAIALTGIGLGFVIGYLANGERLAPLIVYHFLFDLLSMGLALLIAG